MPPKMPSGGMPQIKNARLNIEKDTLTLMVNMGGMAMPMNFEAKNIKGISFRSCKVKKLFKEIDSEELVLELNEMPRMSPPGGMGDDNDMPSSRGSQPPADMKPELKIPKTACASEFDAYKPQLEKFAKANRIKYSVEV